MKDPDQKPAQRVVEPAQRIVEIDAEFEEPSEASRGDGVSEESAPAVNASGDPVGAHVISGFDFTKTRRGGLPAEWFNGEQWKLTPLVLGKHPKRKQMYLKQRAVKHFGVVLNTAFDEEGNLVIQAMKPKKSEKNPLRVKAAKAAKASKKSSKKSSKKAGKKPAKKAAKRGAR